MIIQVCLKLRQKDYAVEIYLLRETGFKEGMVLSRAGDHSMVASAHTHKRPGVPGHPGDGDRLSEGLRAGHFQ